MHKRYTVCYLFDPKKEYVLLIKKPHTDPKWNGVGGALNDGETPYACAIRKIEEDTGIKEDGLQLCTKTQRLSLITSMTLPEDCKTGGKDTCELYFFAGQLNDIGHQMLNPNTETRVVFRPVKTVMETPPN